MNIVYRDRNIPVTLFQNKSGFAALFFMDKLQNIL